MKACAIIVAGGSGKRMKTDVPKQFLLINKKPILIHTLEVFEKCDIINNIIVVCNTQYISYCNALVKKYGLYKIKNIIAGGEQRQNSVYNAIKITDCDIVCIHDAVRMFVKNNLIVQTINQCENNDGCICAVKVKDTIKRCNNYVQETLDRENLYQIQTPQSFKTQILKKVYDKAIKENFIATDDSGLMEHYGYKIKLINGDYFNIKITTPEDLLFAKIYSNKNKILLNKI